MSWQQESLDDWLAFLASVWNLFGLPALLVGIAFTTIVRAKRSQRGDDLVAWDDPRDVIRRIGLIHLGFALWWLTAIVAELRAFRLMGIFPSNPVTGMFGSMLSFAFDVPIGLGLYWHKAWARSASIVVILVRLVLAVLATSWVWRYGAVVDITEWPRFAGARVLPAIILVVLLLPSTGRAFHKVRQIETKPSGFDATLALVIRLFLAILISAVLTDAIDLVVRMFAEKNNLS